MFRPQGVFPAMMTPFDDRGEINEPVVRDMMDFMIEKGVDGIFPVSTCGEFVHMSLEQRKRLIEIVVDQNRGRVPITPGIGATCPNKSIELAQYAKQVGCDGVVLLAPYFFINTQDIVEKYVEVVAHAVDIPLILYNIPFFTNPILPDTVEKLCRIPHIVAIKDSSGNMINLLNNIDQSRKVDPNFHVLIGYEEGLFPALMAGAKGCFTASVGIIPEIMKAIYTNTMEGNYDRARELQYSILELIRLMKIPNFPIGFKAGMEARGFPMGPLRQPLSAKDETTYQRVKGQIFDYIHRLVGSPNRPVAESPSPSDRIPDRAEVERIVKQVVEQLARKNL